MSSPVATERGPSPELRATVYYFILFMAGAVITVYGGIWFKDQGLTEGEIGIINALPVLIMLLLNIGIGRIADRASDWRQVIVIGSVVAGVASAALYFAQGFWGILIIWTLLSLPAAAIGPVIDAATIRMTRRRGTQYGPIRAWGTLGYMVMLVATGFVISWLGGGVFLPLFVGLSLLRAVAAFGLPRFRGPQGAEVPVGGDTARRLRDAMKPFFVLPLVGWSMVFGTHIVLNAFQGLLWQQQGFSAELIGPLLAVGAIAEAALMFVFGRFAKRFSARTLILVSALAAVFRWACMALQPGLEWLIPLQALNAITFALGFLGCMHFIANWTSEEIAAEAQGFFQVLQQAMTVVALVGFGWLMGLMGAQAYFVAAAFAAFGAVLIWLSLGLHGPKRPQEAPLA